MTSYFQAVEERPDTSITCGVIDSAGYRVVWLKAASTADCHKFLHSLGVYADRITPLAQGHTPQLGAGLDFDLTAHTIDRTVNTTNHTCHAFTAEWQGRDLKLKCKHCGAILHETPRPLGGYYSN